MEAKKFISIVLPDGHLFLPEDTAQNIGKTYEVILLPLEGAEIYSYTETLAVEKKFSKLTEKDIEKIIHESRGIK